MVQDSKTKLKICGMRDQQNIIDIGARDPDYMGFIFYKKSPRYVGDRFVIPAELSTGITKVGVFVNEGTEEMLRHALRLSLGALQLHGAETPDQCDKIRDKGYQVIKVFSVDSNFDFDAVARYRQVVDYFMFDTRGTHFGGNAMAFDWSILRKYDQRTPFFLSGGLSPDNVEGIQVLKGMNLHALDVNSGVEQSPGLKSLDKLTAFLKALNKIG
jgi:phosphoribosylanthranilate isomerase